jgi:hypothetical protein
VEGFGGARDLFETVTGEAIVAGGDDIPWGGPARDGGGYEGSTDGASALRVSCASSIVEGECLPLGCADINSSWVEMASSVHSSKSSSSGTWGAAETRGGLREE